MWLELLQFHKDEVQTVNHLIGVLIVDEVEIVIVVIYVVYEILVDKVESINRLQEFVVIAPFRLRHVCLGCIEQHALLERIRPSHLHFYDELTLLVVLTAHVYDAVLFSLHSIGYFLSWPILDALHLLVFFQRQHGIEQTNEEVFVLAEYLLESYVSSRV